MTREEHETAGNLLYDYDRWCSLVDALKSWNRVLGLDRNNRNFLYDSLQHLPQDATADQPLVDALNAFANRHRAAALAALRNVIDPGDLP